MAWAMLERLWPGLYAEEVMVWAVQKLWSGLCWRGCGLGYAGEVVVWAVQKKLWPGLYAEEVMVWVLQN